MTLFNYTDPIPLPAPITSGSGVQSFTDPLGDVWVAANGVKGGNWYRARDVLIAWWIRTTAFSITTTVSALGYNGIVTDPYSMYNGATGVFTAPINGLWRIDQFIGASATATGQWVEAVIQEQPSGGNYIGIGWASAAGSVQAMSSYLRMLGPNQTYTGVLTSMVSSVTLTGRASYDLSRVLITYLGTG